MYNYGFKDFGLKVGLNNWLVTIMVKLLKIKGIHIQYQGDPDFIAIQEETHPETWKRLMEDS